MRPTPADEHVEEEAGGVGVHDPQQRVQVETFHQQPEVVRHDKVVEESHDRLAAHLKQQHVTHFSRYFTETQIWI